MSDIKCLCVHQVFIVIPNGHTCRWLEKLLDAMPMMIINVGKGVSESIREALEYTGSFMKSAIELRYWN